MSFSLITVSAEDDGAVQLMFLCFLAGVGLLIKAG